MDLLRDDAFNKKDWLFKSFVTPDGSTDVLDIILSIILFISISYTLYLSSFDRDCI